VPGLIGFTLEHKLFNDPQIILSNMQKLISHNERNQSDKLFIDSNLCSTRVHLNIIQRNPQPYSLDGIYIWIDGEFYNQSELVRNYNISKYDDDPSILLQLYKLNYDFSFLKDIDGIFSAVIYDENLKKVHLITDRYGLRHLYWTVCKNSLIWCSEIKALLAFPEFKPKIDHMSLKQFLSIGYILENRTWFENVQLVPSGSVLTWDMKSKELKHFQYWWWDYIKPIKGQIREEEIVEELGRLFSLSVKKRCVGNKIGLQLSGGLDSRAILAAMPNNDEIYAFSFGKKGCDDIKYASLAAKKKNVKHLIVELEENNWLFPRIKGIWWTDGLKDLMHMHGIVAISDKAKDLMDINLNGFLGDAVLGGSYIKNKRYINLRINKDIVAKILGTDSNLVEGIEKYKNLNNLDYYLIQNRGRKFIYGGTKLTSVTIEHRKPFFDNDLIEFIYSIPNEIRYDSYIYNKMLLAKYREFFDSIPWQKTGVPISRGRIISKTSYFLSRIKNKAIQQMNRFGINYDNPNEYTDYANWLRNEPARGFLNEVLLNKNALYTEFIPKDQVMKDLDNHLNGRNSEVKLCRYLTFEIWLQQVFEGKYR
jgi:asparagine synthase (glutamine-hydrolysing)